MNNKLEIYFNEELHKYTDNLNNVYTSVTTKLKDFEEHFDREHWINYCYEKGKKGLGRYVGMTKEQIGTFWKDTTEDSCQRGNENHNELELNVKICNGYNRVNGYINDRIFTVKDILTNKDFGILEIDKFKQTLIANKYPVFAKKIIDLANDGFYIYPEIGVYSFEHLISGLIDLFLINHNRKEIVIIDYKTNKHPMMFESGYWKKDKDGRYTGDWISTYKNFKTPLTNLSLCIGNKYALQLSMYAGLSERLTGYKIKKLEIFHIKPNSNEYRDVIIPVTYTTEWYLIKYYQLEFKKILQHHLQKISSTRKTQLTLDLFNKAIKGL